jgi:hypothetical protein
MNTVTFNPQGFIEISLVGNQTAATFEEIYNNVIPLINMLKQEKKPLLCLIDGTGQTGYSLSSDKAALKLLESVDYDKIAMHNISHAEVTNGIIMAIGKSHSTKLFPDRESALAWLYESKE